MTAVLRESTLDSCPTQFAKRLSTLRYRLDLHFYLTRYPVP